jgi:formylglycine-generating enzyme
MKRICLLLFPILFLCISLKRDFWEESIKERAKNIPPDMVLVQGNDSISSFYIGRTEECNRNYLIYLEWLHRIFYADYPEVYLEALPDTTIWLNEFHFNDPFSQIYFRHVAFSYYPVVGINWIQAQKYCHWKGNRFNENLLIEKSILRFNPYQINEDNFNTEAWLSNQFEGIKRHDILLPQNMDTSEALYSLHILVPEFRLPTEAEWELASTKSEITEPKEMFPKNYFLNTWKYFYDKDGYNHLTLYSVYLDSTLTKSGLISDVHGSHSINHMADNVQEWVYDMDFGNSSPKENDLVKAYTKSYQRLADSISRGADGQYREKDSLGIMIYEYLCDDKNGKPIHVATYPTLYTDTVYPVKRIYKGGTNLAKGTNIRGSLSEHSSSAKLGFRCAMTMIKN